MIVRKKQTKRKPSKKTLRDRIAEDPMETEFGVKRDLTRLPKISPQSPLNRVSTSPIPVKLFVEDEELIKRRNSNHGTPIGTQIRVFVRKGIIAQRKGEKAIENIDAFPTNDGQMSFNYTKEREASEQKLNQLLAKVNTLLARENTAENKQISTALATILGKFEQFSLNLTKLGQGLSSSDIALLPNHLKMLQQNIRNFQQVILLFLTFTAIEGRKTTKILEEKIPGGTPHPAEQRDQLQQEVFDQLIKGNTIAKRKQDALFELIGILVSED